MNEFMAENLLSKLRQMGFAGESMSLNNNPDIFWCWYKDIKGPCIRVVNLNEGKTFHVYLYRLNHTIEEVLNMLRKHIQ